MKWLGLAELHWHWDLEKSCRRSSRTWAGPALGGVGLGQVISSSIFQPKSSSSSVCSLPVGPSAEEASFPAPGHCGWWLFPCVWWADPVWELAAPPGHGGQAGLRWQLSGEGRREIPATTNSFLTRDFRCLEKDTGWSICVGPSAHVISPRC